MWGRDVGGGGSDTEIVFATSTNDGATWSAPQVVNTDYVADEAGDIRPDVALDASGKCVVVWERWNDPGPFGGDHDVLYAASTDFGVSWSAPQPLNPDAASDPDGSPASNWLWWEDEKPRVATDGAGSWISVWSNHDDISTNCTEVSVAARRSTDAGATWEPVVSLYDEGCVGIVSPKVDAADVAVGPNDTWIVSWGGQAGYTWPLTDHYVHYRRSVGNLGTSWEPTAAIFNEGPASPSQSDPRLATDGVGNWAAAFTGQIDTPGWSHPMFAVSSNDGASWSAPGVILQEPNESRSLSCDVASDGGGGWFVTWESLLHAFEPMLYHTSNGGVSWSASTFANYPDVIYPPFLEGAGGTTLFGYPGWGPLPSPQCTPGPETPPNILCVQACPDPSVKAVYSSLTHGTAGALRLSLSDGNNIEPRFAGVQRLEFEISSAMDAGTVNPGNVSVTDSASNAYTGALTVSLGTGQAGANTLVALDFNPALDDQECWKIDLAGMTGGGEPLCNAVAHVRTLEGDSNRDGATNPVDNNQRFLFFGQSANAGNAAWDVNTDGIINPVDNNQTMLRFGHTAPDCP